MLKNSFINVVSCILFLFLGACTSQQKDWEVTKYGAIGDGQSLNTEAIQKAIDACSDAGGGRVVLKQGVFLSGTVLLKDNVTLHVAKGATLLGSKNPQHYRTIDPFTDATGQERGKCLVGALHAQNIGISGKGIIDGQGKAFLYDNLLLTMKDLGMDKKNIKDFANNRPFLVRFVKSSGIEVKDITLRQPAAWTLHYFQCSDILTDGIFIYSHAHRNNDGIDLDSSHDVVIKNCDINSGDDAMCFKTTSPLPCYNVHVSDCKFKSDWGTIKFGTESMGDFKNITVEDCEIYDTKGGGIKILSMDGADIDSITIRNIKMTDVEMPVFIRLGERLRTYRNAPKQMVGTINNVFISNVSATVRDTAQCRVNPPTGMLITGTPDHRISNVHLENITISVPGLGTADMNDIIVPEDEERYPEFSFFGVLPSYGMYARHIDNLNASNVSFTMREDDARNDIVLDDVVHSSKK